MGTPVGPSNARSNPPSPQDVNGAPCARFVLRERRQLPVIDCTSDVRHVLWPSPRQQDVYKSFLRSTKKACNLTYTVGQLCAASYWAVDPSVGIYVAIAAAVCLVGPNLVTASVLRYDIARLLLQTYEFWYVVSLTAMSMGLFVAEMRDLRALGSIMTTVGVTMGLLTDASYRLVNRMVLWSMLSSVSTMSFAVAELLRLVPDASPIALVTRAHWRISSNELIANSFLTIAMILFRNGLRRHLYTSTTTDRVRCVALRTRVRFESLNGPTVESLTVPDYTPTASPLYLVPLAAGPIDGGNVLCRCLLRSPSQGSAVARAALFLVRALALVLSVIVIPLHVPRGEFSWLASVTLAATAVAVAPSLLLLNRQVLRLLLTSFDVVFLLAQLLSAHIVLAYEFEWDTRCLPVLSSGLWALWIVLSDALTPLTKAQLAVGRRLLAAAIVLVVVSQSLFMERLLHRGSAISDRTLVTLTLSSRRRVAVRSIPFLFSRFLTLSLWWLRLLWRLYESCDSDDDLLLLQGAVEYEDPALLYYRRRRQRAAVQSASVLPIPRWRSRGPRHHKQQHQ
ncbi:hypothetical protein ATCC90586_008214 [Pythium insidiosum]|nr:hypothetical protein ATCC90586_008214 [Pythium insidiosum]